MSVTEPDRPNNSVHSIIELERRPTQAPSSCDQHAVLVCNLIVIDFKILTNFSFFFLETDVENARSTLSRSFLGVELV